MRAIVQRASRGEVIVDGRLVGSIGPGLVVLLGVGDGDEEADAAYLADKIAHLRICSDEDGKMNRSVRDVGGDVLVVSQFTLYGDARKGRRPSFSRAAGPEQARRLCQYFEEELRRQNLTVASGEFAAHMVVSLDNDGPVTILLDSERQF